MKRSQMKRSPFPRRANKFKAIRSSYNGKSFPSRLERDRYAQLVLLKKAGTLTELKRQPQTYLTDARIGYKPDFKYIEDGKVIFEECKGLETEGWRIKKKLWTRYGPSELRITKRGSDGRIRTTQIIHPKGCAPEE